MHQSHHLYITAKPLVFISLCATFDHGTYRLHTGYKQATHQFTRIYRCFQPQKKIKKTFDIKLAFSKMVARL